MAHFFHAHSQTVTPNHSSATHENLHFSIIYIWRTKETAVHVAARECGFLRPPFSNRLDVFILENCIERLIQNGFHRSTATEICKAYCQKGDKDGLESFICSCEKYDPMHIKERETVGV